ncbi:hypothetical protein [Nitratifractor sp.]|uniref:TlpA family protein disulfide reductase n=1 Tax=Nitratifractor sp. TaxID=2268144 RepID=UPI0025CD3FAE|nr:hypothetical protein [Nitratifractor sp.]
MEQAVLPQKDVAKLLSDHFVTVILDIDNDMLPEGFGYYAVPTFFVINPKGKLLDKAVGGADVETFREYLENFVKQ